MAEFDFTQAIGEARAKYESIAKALDVDRLKADIKDLETQAAAPGLWDDPENAQKITSRLSAAESQLKRLNSASQRIDDVETLVELGHEEGDQDSLDEAQSEIGEIQKDLDQMEIQTLLDGEYDERSAVVTIRSGAGGVDAADFAQMLLRMYLRYCERNGFKAKVMDTSYAEEAGIKSAHLPRWTPPTLTADCPWKAAPTVWCASPRSTTRVAARPASPPWKWCRWSRPPITSTFRIRTSAWTPTAPPAPAARA